MTESDWKQSTDPQAMLAYLRNSGATDRKMRLFACACCRRIWPLLTAKASRAAVETTERFADGLATADELRHAEWDAAKVADAISDAAGESVPSEEPDWGDVAHEVGEDACSAARACFSAARDGKDPTKAAIDCVDAAANAANPLCHRSAFRPEHPARTAARGAESAAQAALLRCIFGNPLRPAHFDPAWRTETVVLMAREMYASRDFSGMPILADALEESGCADEAVLAHCRRPGPHVRGCHVVDLVLNKT